MASGGIKPGVRKGIALQIIGERLRQMLARIQEVKQHVRNIAGVNTAIISSLKTGEGDMARPGQRAGNGFGGITVVIREIRLHIPDGDLGGVLIDRSADGGCQFDQRIARQLAPVTDNVNGLRCALRQNVDQFFARIVPSAALLQGAQMRFAEATVCRREGEVILRNDEIRLGDAGKFRNIGCELVSEGFA